MFYGLPEAISGSQFLVPRLTRDQAREAIVGPAELFRVRVEPRLVNHILNEIGDDPDQLPLMQHSLMRVWQFAQTHSVDSVNLTLEAFQALGGVKESLSVQADQVLEAYD